MIQRGCMAAGALFLLACAMPVAAAPAAGKAAPLFSVPANLEAGPIALRGTLGDAQIQVNLRQKPDGEQGVEGDYFVFGTSQRILLAGEYDAQEFSMEESQNGTDVSGNWYGTVDGDSLTGTWQSVDGTVNKSFNLRLVRQTGARAVLRKQSNANPTTNAHE